MGTLAVMAIKQSKLVDGKIEGTIHFSNLFFTDWTSANRYRCWRMSFEISLAGGQTSMLETKNNNNDEQGTV